MWSRAEWRDLGSWEATGLAPRAVLLHVPGAADPGPRSPLLYVFDGQNAFGDEGTPHGGWRLHEALLGLDPSTHAVPVVVAIASTGARMDELCPWRDHEAHFGGLGDRMLEWVREALAPAVQAELGVPAGPLHNVLGGTSMGGLLALYGHLRHGDAFGGALALSPSFWPGGFEAARVIPALPRPSFSRIYLDCGGLEAEGRMMEQTRRMAERFRAAGYSEEDFRYVEDPSADHLEREWARRLPEAVKFMFRR